MKNLIKTFLITPIFLLCFFAFPQDAAGLTFGYEAAGASNVGLDDWISGSKEASGGVGSGSSITMYLNSFTNNAKCALYDGDGDQDLVVNGTTEEKSSHSGPDWLTFNFSSSPTIANANYYIVGWGDHSELIGRYDSGKTGKTMMYHWANSYGSWPASYDGSADYADYLISIYCTYTAGGAEARRMFLIE